MEIGYFLSSEDHGPRELLRQAQMAADSGMGSVWISDHYHPWVDDQGQSPFVWSVIGGIAATTSLAVTTAVTCPTTRIHPAVIAQAAATCAVMLDGRFELGVGTGEYLNEHIFGDRWPLADERLSMLEEAIEVIRALWTGEEVVHRGRHYTVENARVYTLPEAPPRVLMSAFGTTAAEVAARVADGFISTHPDREVLTRYRGCGGHGPASAGLKLCWGPDAEECARLAHRLWRSSAVPGELSQDLRSPALFEQATSAVTVEAVADEMPCGPDLDRIVEAVEEYRKAGFDRLYLSQIGPRQEEFFEFYRTELAPMLAALGHSADADASMVEAAPG